MRFHAAPTSSLLALVALFTMGGLAGLAGGCAQILGYDGLSARESDASVDATSDSPADVIVTDVVDAPPTGPLHPPVRPAGLPQQASGSGKTLALAVKRVYLGTQTHLGAVTDTAWMEWGYDLDGVCTDEAASNQSIGTCRRVDGSTVKGLVDGDRCRDNNFGSQVMALVATYNNKVESKTNTSLQGGSGSLALVLSDVDNGADDGFAPGALYRLAALKAGVTPAWDGTDVRQVTDDSVTNLDLSQPLVRFAKGYVAGNVWVSGEPSSFSLAFGVGGTPLVLPLESGSITIPLDDTHTFSPKPALIVGAISAANITDAMKPVAEAAGLCPTGPSQVFYDGLISTLQTFPDVVMGAPNLQDTTKTCDGISMGLGFDLAPIQPLTQIVAATPPGPSSCP